MRILFVALSDSIHTARWLGQIADQGWDVHLFPSIDSGSVNSEIRGVTVYHSFYGAQHSTQRTVKRKGIPIYFASLALLMRKVMARMMPKYRIQQLHRVIKKIKPDIIHSMEIQHGAYPVLNLKKKYEDKFPPWIVTNWGSDIYLFGRLAEHKPKIREVLAGCDYYSCECRRDVHLAEDYGLKGKVLPVFPNTGGFNLEMVSRMRQPGPISARRKIMLKGYQHWAGRALVGLRAFERCVDLLGGYEVIIYSATSDVMISAELFQRSTGISVKIMPFTTPHSDILRLHGQARLSLGLSISDAISTSLLEAIVMGSFPIQSWTACADEWIVDGETGILVPPEDPDVIERAIRRALTDDDMVNRAAEKNYRLAVERLDQSILKPKAIEIYTTVAKEKGISHGK